MVRVTGEDLLGAIELLEQHAANQQMGPRHRSEGQGRVGAVENRGTVTIGPANREGELRQTLVAPSSYPIGKSTARPRDAPLIEGDKRDAGRQGTEDQFGLARWEPPPAIIELDDHRGRQDPSGIERLELLQRPVAQLTDNKEAETDEGCPELLPNRFAVGQGLAPHLFEIVIGPDFWPEQVHDDIARVDQHPVAMRNTLDPRAHAGLVQILDNPVGD